MIYDLGEHRYSCLEPQIQLLSIQKKMKLDEVLRKGVLFLTNDFSQTLATLKMRL